MAKLLFFQESPLYEALGIHAIAGAVKSAGHTCDVVIESEEKDLRQQLNDRKFTLADAEVVSLAMFKSLRIHGWVRTADDYRNFGEDCLDPV